MSEPTLPTSERVAGLVAVEDHCIGCSACLLTAPDHFDEVDGEVVCVRQPATLAERRLCEDAAEGCPVEAIVT